MLEPAQEELLVDMVEAARQVPRADQRWHLAERDQNDVMQGPWGLREVLGADVYALHHDGLLRPAGGILDPGSDWVITPEGYERYAEIKQREGEAVQRTEDAPRKFLESETFRASFPAAYAKWSEAERLLWAANSEEQLTTIGHILREATQEFASELLARHGIEDADADVTKVKRRIGAVVHAHKDALGHAKARALLALADYWEAIVDLVQRQEHGGQKEREPLTWQDGRRAVFHTASVMFELAVTLDEIT